MKLHVKGMYWSCSRGTTPDLEACGVKRSNVPLLGLAIALTTKSLVL